MTHEASNPEFKNSATDGTRIKHGYRKGTIYKEATKTGKEVEKTDAHGKGKNLNRREQRKRRGVYHGDTKTQRGQDGRQNGKSTTDGCKFLIFELRFLI